MILQTTTATPTSPATPPREESAATTALVSQELAGSGSRIPVAFWSYNKYKFLIYDKYKFSSLKKGRVYHATKYMALPNILLHDPAL
jgi:hypothetical protein